MLKASTPNSPTENWDGNFWCKQDRNLSLLKSGGKTVGSGEIPKKENDKEWFYRGKLDAQIPPN